MLDADGLALLDFALNRLALGRLAAASTGFCSIGEQQCCQREDETECSHGKPLVLFTAVFQPVGLYKVLENTSKSRWPLKTPAHAILTDRNLSNNLPNFPSFGPAVGGEANQILGNSLNFARLVDAGNDGVRLCEQFFASTESVRMF